MNKIWVQIPALSLACGALGNCLPSSELSWLSTKEVAQELDAVHKVAIILDNNDDNKIIIIIIILHSYYYF